MIEIFNVKYISEKEAVKRYGFSSSWFQQQRFKKQGPNFFKLNGKGRIMYHLTETDEWFKNHLLKDE